MRSAILTTVLLLASLVPAVALAQASVQFRITDSVGRPLDGRVTMAGQPGSLACSTTASRCTIIAPAGNYTVTVAPVRENAPPARSVTVPPSGAVTVALTTRAATVATASLIGGGTVTAVRTPVATAAPGTVSAVRVTPTTTATRTPTATPTATRVATAMPSGGAMVVATAGRPLGSGRVLTVQGSVMDSAGRPVDATITVSNGGGTIGAVTSTAGRFSMFDLAPGTYTFNSRSTRGTTSVSSVTLPPGGIARVTVRVP